MDLVPGNGAAVAPGGTVTAHYTGALAKDGTIFQSSKDTGQPFTAPLTGVIPGWQQGIPGMKAGGTRRLVIPANLAYGAQEQGNIPANSDLVFDIELIDTK
jgi:FKBP-type peptidyl-prolyl cis-trans isomerase